MAEAELLVATLKRTLKTRGLTYRTLADRLGVSEATVKRWFSTHSFTLERLADICEAAGTSLVDLAKDTDSQLKSLDQLTEAQEETLTSDVKLLLVAFLVVNGWKFDDILGTYDFAAPALVRCFARLDRLKLIELLPNNHYHLRISPRFAWRKNGPIQRFFAEKLQQDYLDSGFSGEDESIVFLTGFLTPASRTLLMKRFEDLAKEFSDRNREDSRRGPDASQLSGMILGMRRWRPQLFDRLLRSP